MKPLLYDNLIGIIYFWSYNKQLEIRKIRHGKETKKYV